MLWLVEVDRGRLAEKYGEGNINILTGFEIVAMEDSILLEIEGKNKINGLNTMQKTEKELLEVKREAAIMSKFLIFQPKEAVKVKLNSSNKHSIKDKLYLVSGKACYYLEDEAEVG